MSIARPITARIEEKVAENRLKRADDLARSGAVRRVGGLFRVTSPGTLGRTLSYDVRRNERGAIVCACPDFLDAVTVNPSFRCEHITAVKIAISLRMTEPTAGSEESAPARESEPESETAIGTTSANVLNFTPRDETRVSECAATPEIRPESAMPSTDHERTWAMVTAALETRDAGWSHSVREIKQLGELIVLTASITIGGVARDGIGTSAAGGLNAFREAEIAAVRDAAVKFGIVVSETTRNPVPATPAEAATRVAFPGNPMARSLADLVTSKQLGMIRALSREIGIDAEDETERLMNCATGELSRRAASMLIDHLIRLKSTDSGRARLQLAS